MPFDQLQSTAYFHAMQNTLIDQIVRSRRKSLAIHIERDGRAVVRAPYNMSVALIESFVSKHRKWIEKKKAAAAAKIEDYPEKRFTHGELFPYLGNDYPLLFKADAKAPVYFDEGLIIAEQYSSSAASLLREWYRQRTFTIVSRKVMQSAETHGFKYNSVKATNANRRWGSCTIRKDLNFSWRLSMCPEEIIDYIAAHELAHLRQMNHSSRFWHEVAIICPEYKRHRSWLADNSFKFRPFG